MQAAITHSNGNDKDSVYFDWIAPAAGSGALRFGYNIILSQACSFKGYLSSAAQL
jgi:hypothetical protein